VVKPFDDERFAKAIGRAKSVIQQARLSLDRESGLAAAAPAAAATRAVRFPGRLLISEKGRVLFLPIHIIEFVQAAGKCDFVAWADHDVCGAVGKDPANRSRVLACLRR
jgi:hypothetical protein